MVKTCDESKYSSCTFVLSSHLAYQKYQFIFQAIQIRCKDNSSILAERVNSLVA